MRSTPFIVFSLMGFLAGCAPEGFGAVGFTGVQWPTTDQHMSVAQLRELEVLLKRLEYLSGTPDGVITQTTRAAVVAYKRDLGVPANPAISPALLDSLRANAGVAGVPAPVVRAKAPAVAVGGGSSSDGGSSSGGGGGGGGSIWD